MYNVSKCSPSQTITRHIVLLSDASQFVIIRDGMLEVLGRMYNVSKADVRSQTLTMLCCYVDANKFVIGIQRPV